MDYRTPEEKRAQRKAEKAQRIKAAQNAHVIQSLMSSHEGRAWMREKLESCGVFRSTFMLGHADGSAFNEGQRNVGLILLSELMVACPEAYVQMMREQNDGTGEYHDRRDVDDERNYDSAGRWIGQGDEPIDDELDS